MSSEEFKSLAIITGIGIKVTAIINGEEFSLGCVDENIEKSFRAANNGILSTLYGRGFITEDQWRKLGGS